jgi:hypothetical protein
MTDVLLFMTTCVLRALDTIIYSTYVHLALQLSNGKVIVYATRNKALSHVSGFSIWLLGSQQPNEKRIGLFSGTLFNELIFLNFIIGFKRFGVK